MVTDFELKTFINEMIENINGKDGLEKFGIIKKSLNKYTTELIKDNYKGKSELFFKALEIEHISLFLQLEGNGNISSFEELGKAIKEKRKLKNIIILELIQNEYLSNKLESTEKESLIRVIESGFLDYFDDMYYNRYLSMHDKSSRCPETGNRISLGGINKVGEVVGLSKFTELEYNVDKLDYDSNITKYLLGLSNLITSKYYSEKDLYSIENHYLDSWNNNKNIGIVGTLENYNNIHFFDPEISFFYKNNVDEQKKKDMISLSENYFEYNYGMKDVQLFLVEDIINVGVGGYSRILGRNFPNEVESKEKYGSYIYCIVSNIIESFDLYKDKIEKLTGENFDNIENTISEKIMEEVIYHEFGHNLFRNGYESNFEELKATLFYMLYLYNKKHFIDENETKAILIVVLTDIVKNFLRESQAEYEQYVFMNRVFYYYLKVNDIITFDGNIIKLDFDPYRLRIFLDSMKIFLYDIKDIFENKEREKEIIIKEDIVNKTQPDLEKIKKLLSNKNF